MITTSVALRGRPRDENRDPEILRAAVDVLAEVGYDRLTMEAVASRARAGKATLYRRWEHKADLVIDAISALNPACALAPPDTGSLRGDLLAALGQIPTDPRDARMCVMRGLVSCLPHDERLKASFEQTFVVQRRREYADVFARAVARGELSEACDIQLLVDLASAMVFYRLLMTSCPVDDAFITSIVDDVILPLAAVERC
jgi:AcrR family transcriptional regulator